MDWKTVRARQNRHQQGNNITELDSPVVHINFKYCDYLHNTWTKLNEPNYKQGSGNFLEIPPHLRNYWQLMATWGRDVECFSSLWILRGYPSFRIWSHTNLYIVSTKWNQYQIKKKKRKNRWPWKGKLGEWGRLGNREQGWIWSTDIICMHEC